MTIGAKLIPNIQIGDKVYLLKDFTGQRGTFEGYVYRTPGLCFVTWDSGVTERIHISELKREDEINDR
jgi:hypothetical protein